MIDDAPAEVPQTEPQPRPRQEQPRPKKRDVHGWLILDKPVGETSTHAVAMVKRTFHAKKAGHAGTLDPLASGILPIAMGEATKTVPFVMDGRKAYRFTVTWGSQTTTDDAEGSVTDSSDRRPTQAEIEAILPRFTGTVMQVPPKFSAIKIAGERAYDLARDGEDVVLEARPVEIDALSLASHEGETSTFEAECGKGTYVRALARDFGRLLGCFGHVTALRRTRVGPFTEADSTPLALLDEARRDGTDVLHLVTSVDSALGEIPAVQVSRNDAGRLGRGQSCLLRGADAPIEAAAVAVFSQGQLIAIGEVIHGELHPRRVFHLG
ncbi:MAG: tRNA pseudouridine(55) synthase TruB [Bosea sp. (in: a-proteobacteria)]